MWVVDDVPWSVLTSASGRGRLFDLVKALYHGSSGATAGPGMLFIAYPPQEEDPAPSYKAGWHDLLGAQVEGDSFWTKISSSSARYVRYWVQEVYTHCNLVCHGTSFGQKVTRTNDYLQHPARYAFASPYASAKSFFGSAYVPIENAFWAANARDESAYRTQSIAES
jgi:hypothetical protein